MLEELNPQIQTFVAAVATFVTTYLTYGIGKAIQLGEIHVPPSLKRLVVVVIGTGIGIATSWLSGLSGPEASGFTAMIVHAAEKARTR